jgi:hypothetical protein
MSISDVFDFVQALQSPLNVVILIGAVIVATGVIWNTYPEGVGWGALVSVVFLLLAVLSAHFVSGVISPAFALEGIGGRAMALAYGACIGIFVVVSIKSILRLLGRKVL